MLASIINSTSYLSLENSIYTISTETLDLYSFEPTLVPLYKDIAAVVEPIGSFALEDAIIISNRQGGGNRNLITINLDKRKPD